MPNIIKAEADKLIHAYKEGMGKAEGSTQSSFFSRADLEGLLAESPEGIRVHFAEDRGKLTLIARPAANPLDKKVMEKQPLAQTVAAAQLSVISIDCPPICGGKP